MQKKKEATERHVFIMYTQKNDIEVVCEEERNGSNRAYFLTSACLSSHRIKWALSLDFGGFGKSQK